MIEIYRRAVTSTDYIVHPSLHQLVQVNSIRLPCNAQLVAADLADENGRVVHVDVGGVQGDILARLLAHHVNLGQQQAS